MRKRQYPLSMHLGLTTSSWPLFSDAKDLDLIKEMNGGLKKMLQGMQKYQNHEYSCSLENMPVIWQSGSVSVKKFSAKNSSAALLIIPSLINRSTILDLCEERSFCRWLMQQGVNVYLLDWGNITECAEQNTLDALIIKRCIPAIKFIAQSEHHPLHAMGHCMGGNILLGVASCLSSNLIEKMIFLSTPWDFHAGSQDLLNRVKYWAPSAQKFIAQNKALPMEGLQVLFASLDPSIAAKKFINFCDIEDNSKEAKLFVAVEDWLNDGISLPPLIAKLCLEDWYLKNLPCKGKWKINGKDIDLSNTHQPSLIVTSHKDKLVEYESSVVLQKQLPQADIMLGNCGHIGMIAGENCIETIWKPLCEWIKS